MENNKIFLNIIILFNPNYKNKKINGSTIKSISLINQFLAFYYSIKKNLKIDYRISILHVNDFNDEDLKILNSLDIDLLKFNYNKNDLSIPVIERYIIKTKIKGTHRLIAETDMLLLKNPNFDWSKDVQFNYGGMCDMKQVNYLINKFNLKKFDIPKNFNYKKNIFAQLIDKKLNYKNAPPIINNGLVLIKEDFAKEIYNKYLFKIYTFLLNNKEIKFDQHYIYQWIMGIIFVTAIDNWKPFNLGINYLIKVYPINKFGKENIELLHYCGVGSGELVMKYFPEYFDFLNI